jgi:DNA-binding CsgD family transcriptional regulator
MKAKKELTVEKQVEKLASYGLTNKEISEALGYDDSTLKRKFENFLIKGRANLKQRLKKKQIQVALSGNVSMLIWLGKQYLGQAEKIEESGDYKIIVNRKKLEVELKSPALLETTPRQSGFTNTLPR